MKYYFITILLLIKAEQDYILKELSDIPVY